jgi:hypothetical protein
MNTERGAADHLSDHLDAVVTGEPPLSPTVDPDTAATVMRFFAADDAPDPPSGLANQMWAELMHAHAAQSVQGATSSVASNGHVSQSWSGASLPPPRRRWVLTQLATAALVLLALLGSFVVLGPLRSRNATWLPVLPAITGTPTAERGILTETLIDAADVVLPAGHTTLYVIVTELQPGVSSTLGGQVGTMLYRVEQGSVRISHSGVTQVVNAGEQWGGPVDGEASFENVGDDIARIVEADLLDSTATSSTGAYYASKFSDPRGGTESFVIEAATNLTATAGGVTLERLTLPPGAALESFAHTGLEWVGVGAGRLGVTLAGERLPFRWDSGEERTFGLFKSPPSIPAGTEVTLRNAGDSSLVLYRLTLSPLADVTPPNSTPESGHLAGVIADDILLHATFEQMPSLGGMHQLALWRNQLAPGAEEPVGSYSNTGVGNELCTIESGQVSVEADAPVFLTRAVADPTAAPDPVAPGTTIVLDVGDQLLAPSGVTFLRRNDGQASATVLCFSLGTYGDSARIWSNPPGVTYVRGLPFKLLSTLPEVPVEATVRRLTLAPGSEFAVRDLPGLELVYVESGTLDLVYARAATPATPEQNFTIRAGSGTETLGRTPDQAVLTNRGEEPLVLLAASVVRRDTSEATPRAP